MGKYLKYILITLILFRMVGCRVPYEPSAIKGKTGYLVVDGMIVNGNGQTVVTLTRSTGWHDSLTVVYERNARAQIEGTDNSVFSLTENPNGQYMADGLNLNPNLTYRLKIKTSDGAIFASDYVPVLKTPPIDSITWKQDTDKVDRTLTDLAIYVNTHDPLNNTRYYRWNYEETWKYHSNLVSKVHINNFQVYANTQADQDKLYYCWQTNNSNSIIIDNTVKLSQDVISLKQLTLIQGNSLKKSFIYSILVKQYALTQKAYEFYEIMKMNSEQTGSLFDPQPSEINGNIKNLSNPSEPVIGYVSISNLSSNRVYISKDFFYHYPTTCKLQLLYSLDISDIQYPNVNYPVDFLTDHLTHEVTGYIIAPSGCVNCEWSGGKSLQPSFWPDSL